MLRRHSLTVLPEGTDPGEGIFVDAVRRFPDSFVAMWLDPRGWRWPANIAEEEAIVIAQDTRVSSGLFERHRVPFRDMFRVIARDAFDRYGVRRRGGLDLGSGSSGEMVHQWLPLTDLQRGTWIETDRNPGAVRANKKRYPMADIREGSYLRIRETLLSDGEVPVVTGLSSLDATNFLNVAIGQVREVLCRGGHLVHVQDVRPAADVGVRQLLDEGLTPPFDALINNHPLSRQHPNPYGYCLRRGTDRLTAVSTGELFRRRIGRVIGEVGGFRLLMNNWVRMSRLHTGEGPASGYFLNLRVPLPSEVQEDIVFAVMTVAKKT